MSQRDFVDAYVETALWSTTDNADDSGGEPLDKNYGPSNIAAATMKKMTSDCEKFRDRMATVLASAEEKKSECDDSRAGHDFWLNRNGHGAGFWDGDWPEPEATKLDKESKRFGNYDLYIGDNGTIHGSGG